MAYHITTVHSGGGEHSSEIEVRNLKDQINELEWQGNRLPARPDSISAIAVRFLYQAIRNMWLESKQVLKWPEATVHIMKNLTKQNETLLWDTKLCA